MRNSSALKSRQKSPNRKIVRCAVYTRKSTVEGLDRSFNSLDAQFEACAAYALSQRHEGWELVDKRYDDGGLSGGSLDRPALRRLLNDVGAGQIDVILIYKIDRLTRSLGDFAHIIGILDSAGTSFVSVTQSFNTSTSMGRLTLNMLLSFAQFEREIGAERIRDKIAASKAKGLWTGGSVALGYKLIDRKLVPDTGQASRVKMMFDHCVAWGSVSVVIAIIKENYAKVRRIKLERASILHILKNRKYIGEMGHGDVYYPGIHEAIIERRLFDEVQIIIERNDFDRQKGCDAVNPSVLNKVLFDALGRPMKSIISKQKTARYRDYGSCLANGSQESMIRVSTRELEEVVIGRICSFLRDHIAVYDALAPLSADKALADAVLQNLHQVEQLLYQRRERDRRNALRKLIKRVDVGSEELCISLDIFGLAGLTGVIFKINGDKECGITLCVPVGLGRWEKDKRPNNSVRGGEPRRERDLGLIKLIIEARAARSALFDNTGRSLADIAREQGRGPPYFAFLVKLGFLAPDIVSAIVQGRQPAGLTARKLAAIRNLPMDWGQQREMLGFPQVGSSQT